MATETNEKKAFNNFYTPENSQFYAANVYESLNPDTEEFRVLEILPGTGDEILRCNIIQPFQLDQSYEALSYRAGDPNEVGEIIVNDHRFNAFATLHAAIKSLRYADRSRLLWTDQVCINQNDVVERNSQVQKMRMIYEKAEQVIAWLGPLPGGDIGFNAVQSFWERFLRKEEEHKITTRRSRVGFRERKLIVRKMSDDYLEELRLAHRTNDTDHLITAKALGELFYSPFWSRAWIWQEVVVAKNIRIFWETKSMDPEPFFTAAQILILVANRVSDRELPVLRLLLLPSMSRSMIHLISTVGSLRRSWKPDSPLSVKYLFRNIRHAQSSDLRDKIYAISGLVSTQYKAFPDYTRSPESVYCLSIQSLVAQDRSLDILALCGNPTHPSSLHLPTWCPDWSTKTVTSREPLIMQASEASHRQFRLSRFQASKNLEPSYRIELENIPDAETPRSTLIVEGLHFDEVKLVQEKPKRESSEKKRYEKFVEVCTQLIGEKRALTAELELEVEKTLTVDECGRRTDTGPKLSTHKTQRLHLEAVLGSRRFFISKSGLMGMAPPHVEPGDLLCVLFGATIPFLLRRTESAYTLVGEVYISDGYMEGRAIDEMEAGSQTSEWFEIH